MRTRDPFGMALKALRTALEEGRAPGKRLAIADLAVELRLSTSPVREALSRLCGEGLIEDRRGLGYFTRALPAEDIVGLLELERAHVELAIGIVGETRPTGIRDQAFEAWTCELAERCDSEPIKESLDRVAARLNTIRPFFLSVCASEGESGSDSISNYYAPRIQAAAGVASRVRRIDPGAFESLVKTV